MQPDNWQPWRRLLTAYAGAGYLGEATEAYRGGRRTDPLQRGATEEQIRAGAFTLRYPPGASATAFGTPPSRWGRATRRWVLRPLAVRGRGRETAEDRRQVVAGAGAHRSQRVRPDQERVVPGVRPGSRGSGLRIPLAASATSP